MLEVGGQLNEETKSDFLKKELRRLKEERCILVNKLFAVTKKYTHLKSVRVVYLAIHEVRNQIECRNRYYSRTKQAKSGSYGHRAPEEEHREQILGGLHPEIPRDCQYFTHPE
jgi:hypothetical protein